MTEKVRDFAKKVVELGKNKVQDAQQSFDNAVSYPARHLPQQTPEQKDANIMRLKKAQVDTELWALPKEREAEQYVPGLATARGYMGGGPGIGDQTVAKAVENAKRQPRTAEVAEPYTAKKLQTATTPFKAEESGNIDYNNRPVTNNRDGSHSTVRSMSFQDEHGREVLIPTVVNGKVVSDKDAIGHYYKTGEHMGIFKTPQDATSEAMSVHQGYEEGRYAGGMSGVRATNNPPALSNGGRNVNVQYHKREKGPIPGYRVPDDASRFEEGMHGLLTNSIHQETQTPEDNVAYRQHYNEEAHQEEALRKEAARKANPGKMKLKEAQTEDVYRK